MRNILYKGQKYVLASKAKARAPEFKFEKPKPRNSAFYQQLASAILDRAQDDHYSWFNRGLTPEPLADKVIQLYQDSVLIKQLSPQEVRTLKGYLKKGIPTVASVKLKLKGMVEAFFS